MKNFKTALSTVLLCTSFLLIYNCKKTESNPAQNFLESFLADSLYKKPTLFVGALYYEFGLNFQANKPGKITKVGVRCPKVGSFKVTLWDTDTKAIIFSKTIEQETAATKKWVTIEPLAIAANKKYTYTILSDSWFDYRVKSPITFPYSKTNMVYLGYSWASTTVGTNKFPTTNDNSYIAGDFDFTFQPD